MDNSKEVLRRSYPALVVIVLAMLAGHATKEQSVVTPASAVEVAK